MAAISSLVLSDNIPAKDRIVEVDSPTTPRPGRYGPSAMNVPRVEVNDHLQPRQSASVDSQPSSQGTEDTGVIQPNYGSGDRRDSQEEGSAMDMDMDDDDDEEGQLASDNDGDSGEADSASRKKKGQRFFCTGYPPCSLSFTRSEHLARHIRKHTGERPFQCHCNRRFSRLDNLRQHAQTVHVNEEIPGDSLAATGTRFQRQIRTDRVRPSGRPRTGTGGSTGGHTRGHSRNLSASSIGSTSSNYSVVTEGKRRPPPLLMATDSTTRPSLGLEPPQTPPAQYRGYNPGSPTGLSTPTSAHFSATPGSPAFLSSMTSPVASHARLGGLFSSRPQARRLSVPSGPNPYQHQYPAGFPANYMNQMGPPSSHASSNSSVFASPTSSTFPNVLGQQMSPGDDWRRRTWHASTFPAGNYNYGRPATSGLMYSQTPDAPQPAHAQHATAAAGQAPRLPGIESFDHVQHRSYTPPRRQPSPMQIDPSLTSSVAGSDAYARQGHVPWDGQRPSQYPELDDRGQPTGSWSQQTINEIQNVGMRYNEPPKHIDMGPPPTSTMHPHQHVGREGLDAQTPAKRTKRQAWYGGPAPARTSPEDSSSSDGIPTPGTTVMEVHPMIMPSSGFIESQHGGLASDPQQNMCIAPNPYVDPSHHPHATSFGDRNSHGGDMNRLEALVAVATSGENSNR